MRLIGVQRAPERLATHFRSLVVSVFVLVVDVELRGYEGNRRAHGINCRLRHSKMLGSASSNSQEVCAAVRLWGAANELLVGADKAGVLLPLKPALCVIAVGAGVLNKLSRNRDAAARCAGAAERVVKGLVGPMPTVDSSGTTARNASAIGCGVRSMVVKLVCTSQFGTGLALRACAESGGLSTLHIAYFSVAAVHGASAVKGNASTLLKFVLSLSAFAFLFY